MEKLEAVFSAARLPVWLFNGIFSTNRWLHLVASTLLVGGVLFFVFVVPIATADLKAEHQFAVFGRARWMFRGIVRWSVSGLIVTGGFSLWRMWSIYRSDLGAAHNFWGSSAPWVLGHILIALVGTAILARVTATRQILSHPVQWMWAALVLLLVGTLLASISRQLRLDIDDRMNPDNIAVAR